MGIPSSSLATGSEGWSEGIEASCDSGVAFEELRCILRTPTKSKGVTIVPAGVSAAELDDSLLGFP